MFIRFVVGADGEHHRRLTGIFAEARMLSDDDQLSRDEEQWLETAFDWFNAHLPHPPFSSQTFPDDAVAWFRAESVEHISHMWDIVAILREHGVPVRLLRSPDPGRLVYEDDYQVVVEEWRYL